jgi:hypothetical protein
MYKNQTTEAKEKRKNTFKNTKLEKGIKSRGKCTEEEKQKRYQTNLERYGNIHPTKTLKLRKYISQKQIENGATPKHNRPLRDIYQQEVKRITKNNWIEHFDKINPNRLNRSQYNLDHIYSIQQGFNNNIPPYIIGHWTNLRLLSPSENFSKGMRCDKTKDQLFEDYFNSFIIG